MTGKVFIVCRNFKRSRTMSYYSLLLVGFGGFLGSVLRFLVGVGMVRALPGYWPYGTFAVNLIGCLLIGIFYGLFSKEVLLDHGSKLWIVGFCGGFTTFSSFSYDGLRLLQEEQWLLYGLYTGGSVVLGLLATYIGWTLVRIG